MEEEIGHKPKPPELPLSHRTLVQWEANVDKHNFEYGYIYNFDDEKQQAVIVIKANSSPVVEFTFGKAFPYRLLSNDEEVFVSDSLRDIVKWLDKQN